MATVDQKISASDADQIPARKLYVQLVTRINTQSLHYRSGNEETAASSVSKLFERVRTLLEEHPNAAAFEIAALARIFHPWSKKLAKSPR
jgi:hypothetical protein